MLRTANTILQCEVGLADADEFEVVREVQEYFADYAPLLPSLFSLNHIPSSSRPLYGSTPNTWDPKALELSVQGLTAVLLSLKKKPVIRYERMSGMAKKLAVEVQHRIQTESQLFDFRLTQVPPLLLILDRRNDPVTPVLSQWTYQAMVHELFGIQNGRVDLGQVPDIRPELKEITLTTTTDPFFQGHHLATFGDLGQSLKSYVQSYQARSLAQQPSSINSISDMKRFVEEYPEFRKLGGNVSKHVALVGELSRLVSKEKLLELGEVEQGLATSAGADIRSVQALVTDNSVNPIAKLRLVILYALRYQKTQASNIASLILNNCLAQYVAELFTSLPTTGIFAQPTPTLVRAHLPKKSQPSQIARDALKPRNRSYFLFPKPKSNLNQSTTVSRQSFDLEAK
ncbi:Sec1-domain-containing protein [Stereum hirsutum FP-91666 SS1]|uniref:Sec1-domain-containing protein n=1 Tax=Stereum hirsutum (strain FP-91666) TaxID=721885 RepID=UPI000444A8EB|nr:Sec1-domain-containing protein [Stereum hirsutum FP-91666 SS1]EIM86024.1 Sec1-domain-containing protein [Stereum hirsutum FP-91666 SS1]